MPHGNISEYQCLGNKSLDDIDSLPAPDVIAAEIVENLEAALEQFRAVAEELEAE